MKKEDQRSLVFILIVILMAVSGVRCNGGHGGGRDGHWEYRMLEEEDRDYHDP